MFILETLKHARGAYTDGMIKRAGHIVGPLGKSLDDFFLKNIGEMEQDQSGHATKRDHREGLQEFVDEYLEADLFGNVSGRAHPSFPLYEPKQRIDRRPKLKARLLKYGKKLDVSRSVMPDN